MVTVATPTVGRRWVVVQASRGLLSFAVLGLAACTAEGNKSADGHSRGDDGNACADGGAEGSGAAAGLAWWRVDLAYVSAYVIVRGREAALVDAGLWESAGQIGAVLDAAGPGWGGLRHIVITHAHNDHWAGLEEVADLAPGATLHAGTLDEPLIGSPRPLRTVADGDEVFGLQIVATPGHTPGHIAVFDADSAVLVAGDALTNTIHGLAGPYPDFTDDTAEARDSVRKLATLEPRVILVGHGPPVTRGAAAKLQRLASSL